MAGMDEFPRLQPKSPPVLKRSHIAARRGNPQASPGCRQTTGVSTLPPASKARVRKSSRRPEPPSPVLTCALAWSQPQGPWGGHLRPCLPAQKCSSAFVFKRVCGTEKTDAWLMAPAVLTRREGQVTKSECAVRCGNIPLSYGPSPEPAHPAPITSRPPSSIPGSISYIAKQCT